MKNDTVQISFSNNSVFSVASQNPSVNTTDPPCPIN